MVKTALVAELSLKQACLKTIAQECKLAALATNVCFQVQSIKLIRSDIPSRLHAANVLEFADKYGLSKHVMCTITCRGLKSLCIQLYVRRKAPQKLGNTT